MPIGGVRRHARRRRPLFPFPNPESDPERRCIDGCDTPAISWPNYRSGANGNFQRIEILGGRHPVLAGPDATDGALRYLPAHPHEAAVGALPHDRSARVIATGWRVVTGQQFNSHVAFQPSDVDGPAIAPSTFHHVAAYNWDPAAGAPSFVSEPPGDAVHLTPAGRRSTHRYARNLALWLARHNA